MRRSPREIAERWAMGKRNSPPIECPVCHRKTMAYVECQWCKTQWNSGQMESRKKERNKIISSYS